MLGILCCVVYMKILLLFFEIFLPKRKKNPISHKLILYTSVEHDCANQTETASLVVENLFNALLVWVVFFIISSLKLEIAVHFFPFTSSILCLKLLNTTPNQLYIFVYFVKCIERPQQQTLR